jgi:hypothetical protein
MRRCSAVAAVLTLAGPEQYEKCPQLLKGERPAILCNSRYRDLLYPGIADRMPGGTT